MAGDSGELSRTSILEIAAQAKNVISELPRWITGLHQLPIEDAHSAYMKSPIAADELLEACQSADSREAFLQSVESLDAAVLPIVQLLVRAMQFPNPEFLKISPLSQEDLLPLHKCAYDSGFRISAGQVQLQSGLEAAHRLAAQAEEFIQSNCITDVHDAATFQDILDMCDHDRTYAMSVLSLPVCVDTLANMIDYETAWLRNLYCGDAEPLRWTPSGANPAETTKIDPCDETAQAD